MSLSSVDIEQHVSEQGTCGMKLCMNVMCTHLHKRQTNKQKWKLEFSGPPLPAFFQFFRHSWFILVNRTFRHLKTKQTWPGDLELGYRFGSVQQTAQAEWSKTVFTNEIWSPPVCLFINFPLVCPRNRHVHRKKHRLYCACVCALQLWDENEKAKRKRVVSLSNGRNRVWEKKGFS